MTDPELRDAIRELDELVKYSAIATNDQKHAALYRVCRHLTNVLKTVTRSHPAPPPSPSEENAGEGASDEETPERLGVAAFIERGSPLKRWEQITQEERRAWMQAAWHGYEAGKQHQASADAATIAGLRRVVDAAVRFREQGTDKARVLLLAEVDLLPAGIRAARPT